MTEAQWEKDIRSVEMFILMVAEDWPGTTGLAQLNLAIQLRKPIICLVTGDIPTPAEFLAYDGAKLEVPRGTEGEPLAKLVVAWHRKRHPDHPLTISFTGADYEGVSDQEVE